jgi:geranylgeranyl pyrophosphate synthase
MATDAPAEVIEAVSAWAWELGMVFQITDDALDLVATEGYLGKPAGSDIGEGKFTLPVLLALAGRDGVRTAELLATRPPYPDSLVEEVIELVRSGGYVDRALEDAAARVETAQQAVAGLPDGDAKDILGKLGSYLLGRVQAARTAS